MEFRGRTAFLAPEEEVATEYMIPPVVNITLPTLNRIKDEIVEEKDDLDVFVSQADLKDVDNEIIIIKDLRYLRAKVNILGRMVDYAADLFVQEVEENCR